MKANQVSKFIKDCDFQDATIHLKDENGQLFSIIGIVDISSSAQVIHLDAGHEDEENKAINGGDLVELLDGFDDFSVKITLMNGYFPNVSAETFSVNRIGADFLTDGSRQLHFIS